MIIQEVMSLKLVDLANRFFVSPTVGGGKWWNGANSDLDWTWTGPGICQYANHSSSSGEKYMLLELSSPLYQNVRVGCNDGGMQSKTRPAHWTCTMSS